MFDDEIWDEERWEAYLRENDEQVDRFMELLFGFLADHPAPAPDDEEAKRTWMALLRSFLLHKGWEPDEHPLTLFFDDEAPGDGEDEDAFGLDDNLFLEDDELESYEPFQNLPIYQQAFSLTSNVLDWAHAMPIGLKDSTLVQYCTHLMQVPANIAKGHGMGYEHEMIGGNIACVKRGLQAANEALKLLREMKHAAYMEARRFRVLYEQTYELRNTLGLYVQDLRGRFELGID